MAATAGDLDRDAVGCRHHRTGVHADLAGAHGRPVVHAIDGPDREALEQAVPDHLAGAGIAFLARLEDQHGGAGKVAGLGQVARRAERVGPEEQASFKGREADAENQPKVDVARIGVNFVHARGLERASHASGRVDLFKTQLRMGVQVAPERGEFGVQFSNARKRTAIDTVARCQHQ